MAISFFHAIQQLEEGTLFACGFNKNGQLGTSDNLIRTSFTPINFPVKFSSVSCGGNHFTVACAEDGSLWSWGSNEYGQTALDREVNIPTQIPNTQRFISVSSGDSHSVALDSFGFAWSFGSNSYGKLGLYFCEKKSQVEVPTKITTVSGIQMISCGSSFTLLLDENHRVWSCGDNTSNQLGLGYETSKSLPVPVPNLKNIQSIATGYDHSLALDLQGHVFSFGKNDFGKISARASGIFDTSTDSRIK